jgi:hypothetical protein
METAMPAVTRLGLVVVLLVAAFLALVGVAVASLWTAGQVPLAALVALTGAGGAGSGLVIYAIARREEEEPLSLPPPPQVPAAQPLTLDAPLPRPAARLTRRPLRVQSMPVADLPPEYVHAVMKGARAWNDAWKLRDGPPQP